MYYICKFFNSWTFFEKDTRLSRIIQPEDVALINRFFPDLVENKIFSSIEISLVSPTKLSNLLASKTAAVATYYLCKLLETWSIFEQHTGTSKVLAPTEIARMIGMLYRWELRGSNPRPSACKGNKFTGLKRGKESVMGV
jgi:hypothetical protein